VLQRLVGTPFFHVAADTYDATHPSRSGDLNEYGATFGDFLAGYHPPRRYPTSPTWPASNGRSTRPIGRRIRRLIRSSCCARLAGVRRRSLTVAAVQDGPVVPD
jgi:hypothetical protein